jgi:hypothetical protein
MCWIWWWTPSKASKSKNPASGVHWRFHERGIMSHIHKATLARITQEGYGDSGYIVARNEVVSEILTTLVAQVCAAHVANEGDYKDYAAAISCGLMEAIAAYDRATRKVLRNGLVARGMQDGYNCPRAFLAGMAKLREDYHA